MKQEKDRIVKSHHQKKKRTCQPRTISTRKSWLMLCAIGCMYHGYVVTTDYMMYRTVTGVDIFQPRELPNMAVTTCCKYQYLWAYDFGDENCVKINGTREEKKWYAEEEIKWMKKWERSDRNFDDLLQNDSFVKNICVNPYRLKNEDKTMYTVSIYDIFYGITLRDDRLIKGRKSEVNVTEYLNDRERCLKINLTDTTDSVANPLVEVWLEPDEFPSDVDMHIKVEFGVIVHEQDKLAYKYDTQENVFTHSYMKESYTLGGHAFSIQKMETQRLKFPFKSSCVVYKGNINSIKSFRNVSIVAASYVARGECIEQCTKYYDPYYKSSFDERSYVAMKVKLESICNDMCPLSCSSIQYMTQMREQFHLGDLLIIRIFADIPQTNITEQPYTEIISYLIYLASIVSLWIGSSFYVTPIDLFSKK